MKDLNRTQFEYHCIGTWVGLFLYVSNLAFWTSTLDFHESPLFGCPLIPLGHSFCLLHKLLSCTWPKVTFSSYILFLMPLIIITDNPNIYLNSYFSPKLHLRFISPLGYFIFYRHLKFKTELAHPSSCFFSPPSKLRLSPSWIHYLNNWDHSTGRPTQRDPGVILHFSFCLVTYISQSV